MDHDYILAMKMTNLNGTGWMCIKAIPTLVANKFVGIEESL